MITYRSGKIQTIWFSSWFTRISPPEARFLSAAVAACGIVCQPAVQSVSASIAASLAPSVIGAAEMLSRATKVLPEGHRLGLENTTAASDIRAP
jgi:hypothetical protein